MSDAVPIAVLDYGIGNLRSAQKALQAVGADARLTSDPGEVRSAAGVVLPGVGAFGRCADAMRERGLDDLAREVITDGRPFFGICVGMQLLFGSSEEAPGVAGLGVLDGTVRSLGAGVKIPQMQWNILDVVVPDSQMLSGSTPPVWVYFVHSYAAELAGGADHVVATCDYGGPVAAAIERDNIWATQFHPEKSGSVGLEILGRFVSRAGSSG